MDINSTRRENLEALIRAAGSMTRLANLTGISAAYFSQMRTGHREMGSRIARRLEEALDIPFGTIDVPNSWQGFTPVSSGVVVSHPIEAAALEKRRHLRNVVAHSDGFVRIGLAGEHGNVSDIVSRAPARSIELSESFLRTLTNTQDLGSISMVIADNDSMVPAIMPGDALLLDTSVNEATSDGIYLFKIGSAVHIKRLQVMHNAILVKSDNPLYDSWKIDGDAISEMTVYGRITGSIPLSAAKRLS